ncbi:hypothetical protein FGG44_gp75 [Mycobacterium phage MacnCheese]|uniref:Uncharacterized protein n=1 Tax=Mycobacterium phage MacnCheese TaxID=2927982 RepID=I6WIM8_9CAUD|nr:hypothetical protein FGG44_gp75 [Mycobacterium phage MacnCheese]AFN37763.1 hypothetical protein MACNCHEESE_75 [Mycobacterium phage MacnCheese]
MSLPVCANFGDPRRSPGVLEPLAGVCPPGAGISYYGAPAPVHPTEFDAEEGVSV